MTPPGLVRATWAVLRHELRRALVSTATWVFAAAFLFLAGLFFQLALAVSGEASLRTVLPNWVVTLIFCVPLLTMGQVAGEERDGTLELLLSSPAPVGAVIGGKWLATWTLCSALLLGTLPIAGVLLLYGDPDPLVLLTTYLGLWLTCGGLAAAGLFASTLTREPMVAGVLGALLLLPFWLAGPARALAPEALSGWLERVSLVDHLRPLATGVVDVGDLAWLAGFALAFLFAAWRSMEARRWA